MANSNPRIDDQKSPVDESLVRWKVTPTTFESTSHSPDAVGQYIFGFLNQSGNWSTKTHDSDGNVNEVVDAAHKTTAGSKTGDVAGHEDHRRIGGSRESTKQGVHQETGDSHTNAVDGPHITAASSGNHQHGTEGNNKQHFQGDHSVTVEEGGLYYSSEKGFSVHSNDTVNLSSEKQISQKAGTNWAITAQQNGSIYTNQDFSITSQTKVTVTVGQSSFVIDTDSITLQVGGKGIKIDSSGVSITGTTWVGQNNIGDKTGVPSPPAHFP